MFRVIIRYIWWTFYFHCIIKIVFSIKMFCLFYYWHSGASKNFPCWLFIHLLDKQSTSIQFRNLFVPLCTTYLFFIFNWPILKRYGLSCQFCKIGIVLSRCIRANVGSEQRFKNKIKARAARKIAHFFCALEESLYILLFPSLWYFREVPAKDNKHREFFHECTDRWIFGTVWFFEKR